MSPFYSLRMRYFLCFSAKKHKPDKHTHTHTHTHTYTCAMQSYIYSMACCGELNVRSGQYHLKWYYSLRKCAFTIKSKTLNKNSSGMLGKGVGHFRSSCLQYIKNSIFTKPLCFFLILVSPVMQVAFFIAWCLLLLLQGISMETPTLAGLAPCTKPPTRKRAAPRWGRWGGRRGWCCSAAGAWVCTWLRAAPQCSFWERHIYGARVRNGYNSQKELLQALSTLQGLLLWAAV